MPREIIAITCGQTASLEAKIPGVPYQSAGEPTPDVSQPGRRHHYNTRCASMRYTCVVGEKKDVLSSPRACRKRRNSQMIDALNVDPSQLAYKRVKCGTNTIHVTNCTASPLVFMEDFTSWQDGNDLLGREYQRFITLPDGFNWDPVANCYIQSTPTRLMESRTRPNLFHNAQMNVHEEKPAHRPVQYTRVIWQNAIQEGECDFRALSKESCADTVVDPKTLASQITARLPWASQLVEALAFVTSTGLGIYNNSSLYMKGLVLMMTAERMRQAGIPVPTPDLHLAPVTFMEVVQTRDYIPQYEVIRAAVEEGCFVLVEGHDFTRADVANVCYLALGGSAFPCAEEFPAVPTQSLRWPRIPFLVLCTTAPPLVPQQEAFDSASFMQFVRLLANTRSEQRDLSQAWYDASFLVGSEWIGKYSVRQMCGMQQVPNEEPDDFPLGDDAQHHRFDQPNGAPGGRAFVLPPIHIPDPNAAIEEEFNRANALWVANYARWAEAQQRAAQAQQRRQAAPPAAGRGRGGRGGVRGGDRAAAQQRRGDDPIVLPMAEADYIAAGHPRPVRRQPIEGSVRGQEIDDYHEPEQGLNDRNPVPAPGGVDPANARWPPATPDAARRLHRLVTPWRLVTPFWECNAMLMYHRPVETNFLLRLAGYANKAAGAVNSFPIVTTGILSQVTTPRSMMHLAIWFGSQVFTATTTALYNYNLTGANLQCVSTRQNINRWFNTTLLDGRVLRNSLSQGLAGYPALMLFVGVYFKQIYGAIISPWLFSTRAWACYDSVPNQGNMLHWLGAYSAGHTPRRGDLISSLRWTISMPKEWGLTGVGPKYDTSAEWILWDAAPNLRGWYAERGQPSYLQQANGSVPYALVDYGPTALSTMAMLTPANQQLGVPQQRPVVCQDSTMILPPGPPAGYPGNRGAPVWHAHLRVVQPCTMLSYDWQNNIIMVPWIPINFFGDGVAYYLADVSGELDGVGLTFSSFATAPMPIRTNQALLPLQSAFARMQLDMQQKRAKTVAEKKGIMQQPENTEQQPPPPAEKEGYRTVDIDPAAAVTTENVGN